MYSQQQLIDDLNRKVALLDQYASTLQKQNLAKNNQTATLYAQLNDIRKQNDILRSHLSRINIQNIQRIKKQQTLKEIEKKNTSVNCSVEMNFMKEKQQKTETEKVNVGCQSEGEEPIDLSTIHNACTQEMEKLLATISQKDTRISQIMRESQQMYDTILHLEEENESTKRQLFDIQTKFKTQSKQQKSYQLEIEELRIVLNQERQAIENERRNMQSQRDNSSAAQHEIDRLIRENNRLIERIRMLEKQKNTFYAQLRGRNVSPLKTSQISARQSNIQGNRQSLIGNGNGKGNPYQSEQKIQPQRFSSQFGIGKQKEKVKADRWRQIEEKINRVKEENQQLKANLTIV